MEGGDQGMLRVVPEPKLTRLKQLRSDLCRRSVLTFTLTFAFVMVIQHNVGVFFSTQITSMEREFGFTSLQSGQLVSVGEIGYLSFVLFNGYLASRLHGPRAAAVSSMLVGSGGVLLGLAHFIFSSPAHQGVATGGAAHIAPAVCWTGDPMEMDGRCDAVISKANNSARSANGANPGIVYNEKTTAVLIYLCVIQFFRGALGSTRFPLFVEFIETNSKKSDTGFYIGLLSAIMSLGPGVAFLVGGAISKLHVSLQPTDLTPIHPKWIGAWWLGFLVFGSLATVTPLVLWCFPSRISRGGDSRRTQDPNPTEEDVRRSRPGTSARSVTIKPRHHVSGVSCRTAIQRGMPVVKDFFRSVVELFTNPAYVLLILATCLVSFAMDGVLYFIPKYLQHQFNIPAWRANYIMGGGEMSVGIAGCLVGGWLTRRLKLTLTRLYQVIVASAFVLLLLMVVLIFISCPQPRLIGAPGWVEEGSGTCNLTCLCPDEVFPVCDRKTNENYFSACRAGCSIVANGVYSNCSCTASGHVYPGLCPTDCTGVYFYCGVIFIIVFILTANGPVEYLITVRCVSGCKPGLAVGAMSFAGGVIGFVIGPMLFGNIIDSFCLHWNQPCGARGQCAVYDNDRFRLEMHLYSTVAMALSFLAFALSFLTFKRCQRGRRGSEVATASFGDARHAEDAGRDG